MVKEYKKPCEPVSPPNKNGWGCQECLNIATIMYNIDKREFIEKSLINDMTRPLSWKNDSTTVLCRRHFNEDTSVEDLFKPDEIMRPRKPYKFMETETAKPWWEAEFVQEPKGADDEEHIFYRVPYANGRMDRIGLVGSSDTAYYYQD